MMKTHNSRAISSACGLWAFLLITVWGCGQSEPRVQLFEIPVSDLDRSIAFYQTMFAWDASRPDSAYAILDATPVPIGLELRETVTGGGGTVVVAVPDLEAVLALVSGSGGIILEPIQAVAGGHRFIVADPDGNRLVVWSEAPRGSTP